MTKQDNFSYFYLLKHSLLVHIGVASEAIPMCTNKEEAILMCTNKESFNTNIKDISALSESYLDNATESKMTKK